MPLTLSPNVPQSHFKHWETPAGLRRRPIRVVLIAALVMLLGSGALSAFLVATARDPKTVVILCVVLLMLAFVCIGAVALFAFFAMTEKDYPAMRLEGDRLLIPHHNAVLDLSRPYQRRLSAGRVTATTYVYKDYYSGQENNRLHDVPKHAWATLQVEQDGRIVTFHHDREVEAAKILRASLVQSPPLDGDVVVSCACVPELDAIIAGESDASPDTLIEQLVSSASPRQLVRVLEALGEKGGGHHVKRIKKFRREYASQANPDNTGIAALASALRRIECRP